jgi:hypothetical protein
MELLIPLEEGCGVLESLANPASATRRPAEQLSCAADFMAALVNSGACKFYEIEAGRWVLEVRLPSALHTQQWKH